MTAAVPALTSDAGLSRYLAEIRKFPLLAPEQEYMLARRLRDHGDVEAAHTLVTSHLRLVAKIAMGYRNYGVPVTDLIGEGTVGLMRAVKKFDPEKGFRLATYAMWWIKAQINEYLLASWSLVRIGTASTQKRLFYNLRKMKARLGAYDDGDLSGEHLGIIARDLDVSESDVKAMDRRLSARDSSLNARLGEDGDIERLDLLVDDGPSQEDRYIAEEDRGLAGSLVGSALQVLDPRERQIIQARRLSEDPVTLEDLGGRFGVSRERVRQLENRAMKKLERAIRQQVDQNHPDWQPGLAG
ncbi:RNA polymerase sigma factor RpoH [Roseospirillum parvum]|uniref:RNA polymerase sigma factor RpoH n=1 Tax=Roseospirillum parvum TaxID=83401 RepID=A0A1G7TQ11_9PROT|nr:RNA polymerase sigma factor RpoH [Roseospirillum parvum]SDG37375.1 RNA polymerase sigma-32 factor [Roseospirillum parvum]